ncbi:MAG: winged helix-turn-helix domain-containing protein [Pseudonocardia sp.]|nr:winged helix-turn-helix domain-containing protein [Pseudonocardia sp.]
MCDPTAPRSADRGRRALPHPRAAGGRGRRRTRRGRWTQAGALLAALLVERGTVVSVDRLVDAIWGDRPPRGAVGALRAYVSRLRAALGAEARLRSCAPGYVLGVADHELDAAEFEQLLVAGPSRPSAITNGHRACPRPAAGHVAVGAGTPAGGLRVGRLVRAGAGPRAARAGVFPGIVRRGRRARGIGAELLVVRRSTDGGRSHPCGAPRTRRGGAGVRRRARPLGPGRRLDPAVAQTSATSCGCWSGCICPADPGRGGADGPHVRWP